MMSADEIRGAQIQIISFEGGTRRRACERKGNSENLP